MNTSRLVNITAVILVVMIVFFFEIYSFLSITIFILLAIILLVHTISFISSVKDIRQQSSLIIPKCVVLLINFLSICLIFLAMRSDILITLNYYVNRSHRQALVDDLVSSNENLSTYQEWVIKNSDFSNNVF